VAEGVGGLGPEVAALVERALASPTVVLAASRRHWRELFVTAPVGPGGALEGVVDLLFEGDDGLVVVDYKTKGAPGGLVGSEGTTAHRLQVAAYAEALESATGRAVGRGVLVYLGGPAPVEHVIEGDDLARFRADVRARADALVAP